MQENQTIFGKIIRGEIPARVVFENDEILAFHDIQPAAPVHILVIPKKYIPSMLDTAESDADLLGRLMLAAKQIAAEHNLAGYKLHINVGPEGGQVVPHLHLHLLGGWKKGESVQHI